MLIKWILFFVALTAHLWLWGEWSLQASTSFTLTLLLASVLLLVYLIVPLRVLIQKRNPTHAFRTYWMKGIFYFYIFVVVMLCFFHFSGLIKVLLPIKIALLIAYAFVKFYLKKKNI